MRNSMFLKIVFTITLFGFNLPALADDNWGCTVLLCLANPKGPTAAEECKEPVRRLYRHLAKGRPFPACNILKAGEKTAEPSKEHYSQNLVADEKYCPPQYLYQAFDPGSERLKTYCGMAGAVETYVDGQLFTRTWWGGVDGGDTWMEFAGGVAYPEGNVDSDFSRWRGGKLSEAELASRAIERFDAAVEVANAARAVHANAQARYNNALESQAAFERAGAAQIADVYRAEAIAKEGLPAAAEAMETARKVAYRSDATDEEKEAFQVAKERYLALEQVVERAPAEVAYLERNIRDTVERYEAAKPGMLADIATAGTERDRVVALENSAFSAKREAIMVASAPENWWLGH